MEDQPTNKQYDKQWIEIFKQFDDDQQWITLWQAKINNAKNNTQSTIIKALIDDFALWMKELNTVLWSTNKKTEVRSKNWKGSEQLHIWTQQISTALENKEKESIQIRLHAQK
jgi:hypothetical protein